MCTATNIVKKKINHYLKPTLDRSLEVRELAAKYEEYSKLMQVLDPEKLDMILHPFKFEEQEHFGVLFLDSMNNITGIHEITTGLVNQTPMSPREAFREAIRKNAVSVVFFHNHPSGDSYPSKEDIALTKTLTSAGKILQIHVLDHIIVARGGFNSLCRNNPDMFESTLFNGN